MEEISRKIPWETTWKSFKGIAWRICWDISKLISGEIFYKFPESSLASIPGGIRRHINNETLIGISGKEPR